MSEPLILLVADDLMFPSRVREGLRPTEFQLRVAGTDAAADEAASGEPRPAVILVSLTARRFDPLAVIAGLKADERTRQIPLLAFAGHLESEKHTAARQAGADRTAANSSVALHLPALLKSLLSGVPGAADAIMEIGGDGDNAN